MHTFINHPQWHKSVVVLLFVLASFVNNAAKAQCEMPITLFKYYPYGAICQNGSILMQADYNGYGEFRWYTSATDPNPVQVNPLGEYEYSAFYNFYATNGATIWVSFFDYYLGCESQRVSYTVVIPPPTEIYKTYAGSCGNGTARIQMSSNVTSGITYHLWKWDPNAWDYFWQDASTTGFFEVHDFLPEDQYNYYVEIYHPGGCYMAGYFPVTIDIINSQPPGVGEDVSACQGQSAVLSTGGIADAWHWFDANDNFVHEGYQYTLPNTLPAGFHTYKVRGYSNSGCYSSPATITTLIRPWPVDGTISASATTIYAGQAVTISSGGGSGVPHYWCSSDGGASWNVFQNAFVGQFSFTYQLNTVGTYRFHLRKSTSCGFCWDSPNGCPQSAIVDVNVIPYPPVQIASVTPAYQIIPFNSNAATLTVNGVSGGNQAYTYQWQRSVSPAFTNPVNIPNATSSTYTPAAVTGRTFYRVVISTTVTAPVNSPVAEVDVYPTLDGKTIFPGKYVIQSGASPGKLSAAPATGGNCNNSYQYQWQVNTDGTNWLNIGGAQGLTYEPGALSATTYYRRRVICGSNEAYTNACQVIIGTIDVENLNYVRTRTFMHGGITDEQTAAAIPYVKEVKQATEYFDGIGRTTQTVLKQAGMNDKDLVTPVFYDPLGRQTHSYLPFVSGTWEGNYKQSPLTELNQYHTIQNAGESFYYGLTVFESSPLNRVEKKMTAGDSWTGSNRGIEKKYELNTATDDVKVWNVINVAGGWGIYRMDGAYDEGKLFKTITVDEKGSQVIEFTDKLGNAVLKKVQVAANATDNGSGSGHGGWHCTYYVYDDLRLLRAVIQPKGVEQLRLNGWNPTADNGIILNEQCFRYEYDEKGRMIMKKVPGAGAENMIYDKRDRLVMKQDANMANPSKMQWLYTEYDELNRPVATWLITDPARYNDAAWHRNEFKKETHPPLSSYSNELLTETHYDNYDGIPTGLSASLINSGYTAYLDAGTDEYADPLTASGLVTGLVTWTKTKVLEENKYIVTCNVYDEKQRAIQVQTKNYTSGLDVITSQYSFSGQLLRNHVKHEKGGLGLQTYEMATKNKYDALGRLESVAKKLQAGDWKEITTMAYDGMGQLKTKILSPTGGAGGAQLESLEYDYNIRGWILGVNRQYAKSTTNTDHYFGFDLGYDKQTIATLGSYAQAEYNGNIAGTVWKSKGDGQVRKYDFTYDLANRLTGADFNQYNSAFNKTAGIDFSVSNLTYDLNGNILSMDQKGLKTFASSYIDRLRYTYEDRSNKLKNVIDLDNGAGLGDFTTSNLHTQKSAKDAYALNPSSVDPNTITDYSYDNNGNLSFDHNKDIQAIHYNHLNLPRLITINNKGSVEYVYDAAGVKLKKIVHENGRADKTTLYQFGTYENDVLQFLPMDEGRIRPVRDDNGGIASFTYDYFVKDHLGNVRAVLTEEQDQDIYPAATLENVTHNNGTAISVEDDYYNIDPSKVVDQVVATGIPVYQNNNGIYNNNYHSDAGANSARLYKLNADGNTPTDKTGLGITIKVMAGDAINIFGKSYHKMPVAGYTSPVNTVVLTELINGFAGTSIVSAKGVTGSQISGQPGFPTSLNQLIGNKPEQNSNRPKAAINWIILDDQFKYVSGGFDMVGDAVNPDGTFKTHNLSTIPTINIPKNGYIYVYCSNESQYNVFFDNLQVVHTKGPLVEETHYYPFGLTMAGISSKILKNNYENKKGYNGNELQNKEFSDGSGLEYYDFNARTFDQQTGRFIQIDPLSEEADQESWSPYHFGYNNPVLHGDPDGKLPIPLIVIGLKFLVGAAVEYGSQVYDNYKAGKTGADAWKPNGWRAVGKIALNGATSAVDPSGGVVKKAVISTATNVVESVGGQLLDGKGVSLQKTVTDVAIMTVSGNVKVDGSDKVARLEKKAEKLERKAINNPKPTRFANAAEARTTANRANYLNQGAETATTESTESAAGKAVDNLSTNGSIQMRPTSGSNQSDNTTVKPKINLPRGL